MLNSFKQTRQRWQQRIEQMAVKRNPPQALTHRLTQRNLYILPTRFGVVYAVILLLMFLAAINYQNSMAFLLTFLLTSLGLISLWQTHQNLHGLEIRLQRPARVHAGQQSSLRFQVINHARRPRYAVGLQYLQFPPAYVSPASEHEEALEIVLPGGPRGQYQLAQIVAFTRFPTGLFHAWSWLKFEQPVWVYPKAVKHQEFDLSWMQNGGNQGKETREGDDFAGLRAHRSGESLKHISWKAFAQGRGLLSKSFHGHALPEFWIDWEQTLSQGNTEERLGILTSQLLEAEQQQRHYGLRLPGVEIAIASGPAHLQQCLEQLSLFRKPQPGVWLQESDS